MLKRVVWSQPPPTICAVPRDGFHFEAQWQNVATYAGAPFEVALDHNCNLFVANKQSNQILKYNAAGQQTAA
jgi:hypothetical protein